MVNGDMEGGQPHRRRSRVNGGGRVTQEKGTEVGDKGKMERRERGDKEEGGGRQKEGQDLKTEGRRTRVGGESRERRI